MTDVTPRFKQPAPPKKPAARIAYASKKRRAEIREWSKVRIEILDRAEYRCEARTPEVCTIRATECHHLQMRSQLGRDEPSNLVALCAACHGDIHRNPASSYASGWLWSPRKGEAG